MKQFVESLKYVRPNLTYPVPKLEGERISYSAKVLEFLQELPQDKQEEICQGLVTLYTRSLRELFDMAHMPFKSEAQVRALMLLSNKKTRLSICEFSLDVEVNQDDFHWYVAAISTKPCAKVVSLSASRASRRV